MGAKPEYHDTHTLTISYLTDAEMLSQVLPEPLYIDGDPLVYSEDNKPIQLTQR